MTTSGQDPSEIGDSGPLERSQDSIEEAKSAAKDALADDYYPGSDLDAPATGDGIESDEHDVAPRPN
ncbi:MAG TPA: hypothetical protein VF635_17610 [Propionibacteriaceae bacterium]|jgi:hypothetical protein